MPTPKQGRVGEPDNAKKGDLDKGIAQHYRNLREVQGQASNVGKQLKEQTTERGIVQYLLRLNDLKTKTDNIGKEMAKEIKHRIELFGNEDMVSLDDVPEDDGE